MAGKRLFCNRRWLNPNDPDDRTNLEHSYDALTAQFPAFARCTRSDFLQCLAEVCAAASSERASDDRAAALSPSPDADADRDESWSPESFDADRNEGGSSERSSSLSSDFSSSSPVLAAFESIDASPSAVPALERFPQMTGAAVGEGGLNPVRVADGAAAWAGADTGLNAGEAVDIGLFQRWASAPTSDVDPGDLENFGRSRSF
jgi:hypothetical protein